MRGLRLQLLLLPALGLLVALGFRCSAPPREPAWSGPLGLVRFPEPWVKQLGGQWVGVNDNIGYVVRKGSRGPAGEELLFAVKQGFDGTLYGKEVSDFPVTNPGYDYYSDTLHAVTLDGAYRVRKATAAEWDAAAKPPHSYHLIDSFKNPQVTPEGVNYKGRLYRKSGAAWGTQAAIVSPRAKWLAVFSYASNEKPSKPLLPGFGNTEPGRGEVFLDVYDTASGERVVAARAPYGRPDNGFEPSMLFGDSLWVEERYLIMPLDWQHESCFLAILPER